MWTLFGVELNVCSQKLEVGLWPTGCGSAAINGNSGICIQASIERQWLECLKTQNFFLILFLELWFISFFAGTVCATTCVHAGLLSGKGTTPIPLPLWSSNQPLRSHHTAPQLLHQPVQFPCPPPRPCFTCFYHSLHQVTRHCDIHTASFQFTICSLVWLSLCPLLVTVSYHCISWVVVSVKLRMRSHGKCQV